MHLHYVKGVRIRSFSGPYFPAFGLNTERYSVSFRIQSEYRKIRTRITPNTDTFYAVLISIIWYLFHSFWIKASDIFLFTACNFLEFFLETFFPVISVSCRHSRTWMHEQMWTHYATKVRLQYYQEKIHEEILAKKKQISTFLNWIEQHYVSHISKDFNKNFNSKNVCGVLLFSLPLNITSTFRNKNHQIK